MSSKVDASPSSMRSKEKADESATAIEARGADPRRRCTRVTSQIAITGFCVIGVSFAGCSLYGRGSALADDGTSFSISIYDAPDLPTRFILAGYSLSVITLGSGCWAPQFVACPFKFTIGW